MGIDILIIFAFSAFVSWKTYEYLCMNFPSAEIWPFFISFGILLGGGTLLSFIWGCVSGANPNC